jgi:galactose mutarotase-like enzyme
MFSIENDQLKVIINSKGAELQSIFNKEFGIEYMWSGDAAFWGKKSPVLFPIVGTLKNDTYFYNDKAYKLSRHGFARDMEFEVADHQKESVSFFIKNNESTFKNYPFAFEFFIKYAIDNNKLAVTYTVKNIFAEEMYFSVGGHPAFKVPLAEGTTYTDYYLQFNNDESLQRWPISADGLIENKSLPVLTGTNVLQLTKELFSKDALVFKHPASSVISLRSGKTNHGLDFNISGFPYLGIWAAKNADFVCIEPWCGIADSIDTNQQLIHKEGINKLNAGEIFERSWSAKFF